MKGVKLMAEFHKRFIEADKKIASLYPYTDRERIFILNRLDQALRHAIPAKEYTELVDKITTIIADNRGNNNG